MLSLGTMSWISLILFPALLYSHLLNVELRHNVDGVPRQLCTLSTTPRFTCPHFPSLAFVPFPSASSFKAACKKRLLKGFWLTLQWIHWSFSYWNILKPSSWWNWTATFWSFDLRDLIKLMAAVKVPCLSWWRRLVPQFLPSHGRQFFLDNL